MTVPTDYFDRIYAQAEDPWGFADRWYEQRKYALTLASLPEQHYGSAYEPGASIGVLSALLARRCDTLLSSDASAAAVERAAARLSLLPGVTVEQRRLPQDWPGGTFDLVVVSELLYYFGAATLLEILGLALTSVAAGGTFVAVHWRHRADDHPWTGDEVHAQLATSAADAGLVRVSEHVEADFLLDVYVRPRPGSDPATLSVARQTGVV